VPWIRDEYHRRTLSSNAVYRWTFELSSVSVPPLLLAVCGRTFCRCMQLGALTAHKRSSHPLQPEFATFATASLLIFRSTKVRSQKTHTVSTHADCTQESAAMAIKHNQQIQKNHFHKDWYATSVSYVSRDADKSAGNATSACTSTR
jgi:hypothetical protein